ncbi:hypothetical protein FA13DRAFT_1740995 [Coprinellus micaceus]|uniref:Uncharacterized protein n=1 Tax=Coprinellus micaceus TaxID=71717 RepID=A0A4Y7SL63_COPMI|nr:hypothetical protein FA13DRAFT_1740995 [Coprinellus micaceus]
MASTPATLAQSTAPYTSVFLEVPEAGPSNAVRPGPVGQKKSKGRGVSPSRTPYQIRTHWDDKGKRWRAGATPSKPQARPRMGDGPAQIQNNPSNQGDGDAYIL